VGHFVRKFARRLDQDISCIRKTVIEVLWQHDWPGNIRELQNFLERAVIMSSCPELHLQGGEFKALIKSAAPSAIRTRAEADVTIFSMCSGGLIGWWMDTRARPRNSVCRARLCT
jgi:DNA-binding NtrC family response regulator